MVAKSIRFSCLVVTVTLLCKLIPCESSSDGNNTIDEFRKLEILSDLPLKEDLEKYLIYLDNIVSFALKYKHYINANFAFGFFLTNINLSTAYSVKGENLPENLRAVIANILKKISEILKYLRQMLDEFKVTTSSEEFSLRIPDIFLNNDQSWINHLKKYSPDLLKITNFYTKQAVLDLYGNWEDYSKKVFDYDSHVPTPKLSDQCINMLTGNLANIDMKLKQCNVSQTCVTAMIKGTNYGYAIIHRLLYFILARYGRGCTVFTSSQDKILIDRFCATIYKEADYISTHRFELGDLVMEQIALCSLEGHVQFLRRSWFQEFLEFQHELGCISDSRDIKHKEIDAESIYNIEVPEWIMRPSTTVILNGVCDTHTSGVASGAFSAAIRYILEKYY